MTDKFDQARQRLDAKLATAKPKTPIILGADFFRVFVDRGWLTRGAVTEKETNTIPFEEWLYRDHIVQQDHVTEPDDFTVD